MQQQRVQLPGSTQLRDWMKRRGFDTQDEVAGFLGIDPRFVSEFLNEKRRPGLKYALVIERKTGIPVEAWVLTEVHSGDDTRPERDDMSSDSARSVSPDSNPAVSSVSRPKSPTWYCGMCDCWYRRGGDCRLCGFKLEKGA